MKPSTKIEIRMAKAYVDMLDGIRGKRTRSSAIRDLITKEHERVGLAALSQAETATLSRATLAADALLLTPGAWREALGLNGDDRLYGEFPLLRGYYGPGLNAGQAEAVVCAALAFPGRVLIFADREAAMPRIREVLRNGRSALQQSGALLNAVRRRTEMMMVGTEIPQKEPRYWLAMGLDPQPDHPAWLREKVIPPATCRPNDCELRTEPLD